MTVDKLLALVEKAEAAQRELEDAIARLAIRHVPTNSKQARRLCAFASEQGITELPEFPPMPPMPEDFEL